MQRFFVYTFVHFMRVLSCLQIPFFVRTFAHSAHFLPCTLSHIRPRICLNQRRICTFLCFFLWYLQVHVCTPESPVPALVCPAGLHHRFQQLRHRLQLLGLLIAYPYLCRHVSSFPVPCPRFRRLPSPGWHLLLIIYCLFQNHLVHTHKHLSHELLHCVRRVLHGYSPPFCERYRWGYETLWGFRSSYFPDILSV